MSVSYKHDFDGWEIAVARSVVGRFLAAHPGFQGHEKEDLIQECLIHWFRHRDTYDPKRGAARTTYMGAILERRLAEIMRGELTDLRRVNQTAVSLDEPLGDEPEAKSRGDSIPAPDEIAPTEQALDIACAMANLSPAQRALCDLLSQELPMTEIADMLDRSRSTLYDEIKRIRKLFIDAGLDDQAR